MPDPQPAPPRRTLRSVNAGLYLTMALGAVGALVWAGISGRLAEPWQLGLGSAATLGALLWALAHAALRYTSTPCGLTRRSLTHRSTHSWADLRHATCEQSEAQGIASCCISLTFDSTQWRISSEQFPLEEVQEMARELAAAGLLPTDAQETEKAPSGAHLDVESDS